jgi:hypothetical protein
LHQENEEPIQQKELLAKPADELCASRRDLLDPISRLSRKDVSTLPSNQFYEDQAASRLEDTYHFPKGLRLERRKNVLDDGHIGNKIKHRVSKRQAEHFFCDKRGGGSPASRKPQHADSRVHTRGAESDSLVTPDTLPGPAADIENARAGRNLHECKGPPHSPELQLVDQAVKARRRVWVQNWRESSGVVGTIIFCHSCPVFLGRVCIHIAGEKVW